MANDAATAILAAGSICGILDGLSAIALTLILGEIIRTFQGIAGGILGPATFPKGVNTALPGVVLHFVIAFGAAAVYYIARRYIPILIDRALLAGNAYGIPFTCSCNSLRFRFRQPVRDFLQPETSSRS